MKINRKNIAMISLILGMTLLTVSFSTNNNAFSWAAVGFTSIALFASRQKTRPRRK